MADLSAVPDKGMKAGQLGFQVHHRIYPVHVLEQGFELGNPVFPLVLHRPIGHAEMDYLGLEGTAHQVIARYREHFPAQKGPFIGLGKLADGPAVMETVGLALLQSAERQMFDTPINDGLVIQAAPLLHR